MKAKIILLFLPLVFGSAFGVNWKADAAKAKVEFSVKGPFGTVHGNFTGLKASIQFDEKDPAAGSITASIDAKTVSSGVGMRNHHLRDEEQWLNTNKYPTISYKSSKIRKSANGFVASGELTLKGITKPVEIPFTFSPSGKNGVFKGQFSIRREDYQCGKDGGSVGDDITLNLEVPVSQ